MSPAARHSGARSCEKTVQEPAEIAGVGLFAVTAAEHPEPFAGVVLELEVVAHRVDLAVSPPPFAEDPLRPVRPLHPPANAAPSEGRGRLVRQKGQGLDALWMRQQPRRPRPVPV